MKRTLIIGFGNLDREDDGVAWHIADRFARKYHITISDCPEEDPLTLAPGLDLLFLLQLSPEISEIISTYERVCFIDAHTGSVPEELHLSPVEACFQNSPLTHHMTPETCMYLARDIYQSTPEALLISVRGYSFTFNRSLSSRTDELANLAIDDLEKWVNE